MTVKHPCDQRVLVLCMLNVRAEPSVNMSFKQMFFSTKETFAVTYLYNLEQRILVLVKSV